MERLAFGFPAVAPGLYMLYSYERDSIVARFHLIRALSIHFRLAKNRSQSQSHLFICTNVYTYAFI